MVLNALRRWTHPVRQWVVDWLLADLHLRGVKFGENSITMSPSGVGDVVRWDGTQAAAALGDLGMNVTSGKPTAYVDGAARSLADVSEFGGPFFRVRVANNNIDDPVSIDPSNAPLTIANVTLAVGDLVLLQYQGGDDGIYKVDTVGGSNTVWSRAIGWTDGDLDGLSAGVSVYVEEGSYFAKRVLTMTTTGKFTVGTSSPTFEDLGGGAESFTASPGGFSSPTFTLKNSTRSVDVTNNGSSPGTLTLNLPASTEVPGRTIFITLEKNGTSDTYVSAPVGFWDGSGSNLLLEHGKTYAFLSTRTPGAEISIWHWYEVQTYGSNWDLQVRVVATENIDITAASPTEIDGVTMSNGERVLLAGQTTASENGVYYWRAFPMTGERTEDFDDASQDNIKAGKRIRVTEGTFNAGKTFELKTSGTITIDTTDLEFVEVYGDRQAWRAPVVGKDYIGNVLVTGYVGNDTAANINALGSPTTGDAYVVTVAGTIDGASADPGDIVEYDGANFKIIAQGVGGVVADGINLIANRTTTLISPLTDGVDENKVFAFDGTLLTAASSVTPSTGYVVAAVPGDPNVTQNEGDVLVYDPGGVVNGWNELVAAVGGFPPEGTDLLAAGTGADLVSPLVSGDAGKYVRFDGSTEIPGLESPSDGDIVSLLENVYPSNIKLWQYDEDNTTWIAAAPDPAGGAGADSDYVPYIQNTVAETATFTAVIGETHLVDTSLGGFTANLPAIAAAQGRIGFYFTGTGGQLTIDPSGAEQIEGKTTIKLQQGHNTIENDGTEWKLVQKSGRTNTRLDDTPGATESNYSPTDWGRDVTHLYLNPSAESTLTGIEENGFVAMDSFLLVNEGTANIVIAHDSVGSLAANRILIEGERSVHLQPGGIVEIIRDGVANKWRMKLPGRIELRSDTTQTQEQSAVAFPATQATASFTGDIDVNDYDDIDVYLEVLTLGGNTEATVFAESSGKAAPAADEFATLQSDDQIAAGAVNLADYLAKEPAIAANGWYHWNFPSRGAVMRFGVFGNAVGGTFNLFYKRNVRRG